MALGPPEARARLYHSTAVLLPDASVLVAGGGAPGPQINTNIEIYYPSYLYSAGGGFATRPVIEDAPGTVEIGETFDVEMVGSGAVNRVVMVKSASVTHSWNMEQRFVELTFQQNGEQPARAGPDAADGCAARFLPAVRVQCSAGTPAVAPIVRVGVAADPNPGDHAGPRQSGQPGQRGRHGDEPALSATDPNGDTLSYGVSGLPPGLSIHPTTGTISGTPSAAGTFNVVVTRKRRRQQRQQEFHLDRHHGSALRPQHAATARARP